MLERPRVVVEPQQQRAHRAALAALVPAESRHHAVALAFVLDLEHHPLVRLIAALRPLGHHAVEPGALEAPEPVGGDAALLVVGVACRAALRGRASPRARAAARETAAAAGRDRLAEDVEERPTPAFASKAGPRAKPPDGCACWSASKSRPPRLRSRSRRRARSARGCASSGSAGREVAVERLSSRLGAAARPVAGRRARGAVPLRSEDPALTVGKPLRALGEHRQDGGITTASCTPGFYRRCSTTAEGRLFDREVTSRACTRCGDVYARPASSSAPHFAIWILKRFAS